MDVGVDESFESIQLAQNSKKHWLAMAAEVCLHL
jgi:hypothetical protein